MHLFTKARNAEIRALREAAAERAALNPPAPRPTVESQYSPETAAVISELQRAVSRAWCILVDITPGPAEGRDRALDAAMQAAQTAIEGLKEFQRKNPPAQSRP